MNLTPRLMEMDSGDSLPSHHASLARQIYPLLAQELRGLLTRLGLNCRLM